MPRSARLIIAGLPLHIVQRGVDRQDIFLSKGDFRRYLGLMEEALEHHPCAIHAYVLMTNHVHLLLTPGAHANAALFMKRVGQQYVQGLNRSRERTGGLFEGRFRSSIVETQQYFLRCQRYIELNPVRAGLARHPAEYPWSSYGANAEGQADKLVTPHLEYLALGQEPEGRRQHYRALFDEALSSAQVGEIRSCLNSGTVLGSEHFVATFERCFGTKGRTLRRGRKPGYARTRCVPN